MSDQEVREVTFEEALVNRMAQRIGALSAQLDIAQLTIEMRDQEIARLTQQLQAATEPHEVPPPEANGDSTVSTEGGTDEHRGPRPNVPEPAASG